MCNGGDEGAGFVDVDVGNVDSLEGSDVVCRSLHSGGGGESAFVGALLRERSLQLKVCDDGGVASSMRLARKLEGET